MRRAASEAEGMIGWKLNEGRAGVKRVRGGIRGYPSFDRLPRIMEEQATPTLENDAFKVGPVSSSNCPFRGWFVFAAYGDCYAVEVSGGHADGCDGGGVGAWGAICGVLLCAPAGDHEDAVVAGAMCGGFCGFTAAVWAVFAGPDDAGMG